jgi:general secretion pathway protein D
MLKVKPRLSSDGKVALSVEAKLEDTLPQSQLGLPLTTKREIKTTAIVSNGEAVIIGGLIKDDDKSSISKVPFLGDIPFLGALFRYKEGAKDKINLVIILTPYIVDKSMDLANLRARLNELDKLQNEYARKMKNNEIVEK